MKVRRDTKLSKHLFLALISIVLAFATACHKGNMQSIFQNKPDSLIGNYYCQEIHSWDTGVGPVHSGSQSLGYDTIAVYQSGKYDKAIFVNGDSLLFSGNYPLGTEYSSPGGNGCDGCPSAAFYLNYDSIGYFFNHFGSPNGAESFYTYQGHKIR